MTTSDSRTRLDTLWLIGACLLLIGTGLGLRDPWPADEPRFALVVRDMVATNDWLLPRIGGDIYADKPPLFFWIMGVFVLLTDSLRASFLIPSLLASLGSVLLVRDLARRLWDRETGLAAGYALLLTFAFAWQGRQAQIDATLLFWCVLGLYGLMRHLLLGPSWRWFAAGCAAAGFGVITKGVGFLPLLMLIPFALLRHERWRPRARIGFDVRWLLGAVAFLAAISVWLAPMLLAAANDPLIAAYRDEILFHQTVGRYTAAWHHHKPFWYFVVAVIPGLWLPLTLFLPWLVPKWRQAWRDGDLRVVLPLAWAVLVVLFFSASSGKRGVYVLPALPAVALAAAPYLRGILDRSAPRRLLFGLAVAIGVVCVVLAAVIWFQPVQRAKVIDEYEIDAFMPLLVMGIAALVAALVAGARRAVLAWGGTLAAIFVTLGLWINPMMDDARSGKSFIARVERADDPAAELAFVGFKEQYLLQAHRSVVHFGHARWREADQEAADAALWLSEDTTRQLVVNDKTRQRCFANARSVALGTANRLEWFIVRGEANPDCVARGQKAVAYFYSPPGS